MEEKYCSKCRKLQPIRNFTRKGKGRHSVCNKCRGERDRLKRSHYNEIRQNNFLARKEIAETVLDLIKKVSPDRELPAAWRLARSGKFKFKATLNELTCYYSHSCFREILEKL